MKYKVKVLFLLALISAVGNINNSLAAPVYYDKSLSGSQSLTVETVAKPKIEGNSGQLRYEYKIELPEGRNSLQPELSIGYSSEDNNNQNIMGYGFSLSLPYIQINNKTGIERMYQDDNYISSQYGDLIKSTTTPSNYFAKKNDETLSTYIKNTNSWEVTNSEGVKYFYGVTPESRIENASNTSEVYTWYISEIRDIYGNNIKYYYIKDAGQVYLSYVSYTNYGLDQGIYNVRFNYETRADYAESYRSGFRVYNDKRLASIDISVMGSIVRSYKLRYTAGVNSLRSLLAGITEEARENGVVIKSLPETTFGYTKNQSESKTVELPEFDRITDINGDGLNDLIYSRVTYLGDYFNNSRSLKKVYLNNGDSTFKEIVIQDVTTNCNNITNYVSTPNCREIPQVEIPFYLSEHHAYQGMTQPVNNFLYDYDGDGYVDVLGQNIKGEPHKMISKIATTTTTIGTSTQTIVATSSQMVVATSSLFWTQHSSVPTFAYGFKTLNKNGDNKPDLEAENFYANNTQKVIDSANVYVDVNNDGLDDRVQIYINNEPIPIMGCCGDVLYKKVWINNGVNFMLLDATATAQYNLPASYLYSMWNGYRVYNNLYIDFNYDGLIDSCVNEYSSTVCSSIFANSTTTNGTSLAYGYNIFAADLNGDGLVDVAANTNTGTGRTHNITLSVMKPDLLSNIKNTYGGETKLEYAPAVSYLNDNGVKANRISYPVWTVKKEIVNDGLGNTSETKYNYEEAYISRLPNYDNTLTGFGKVTSVSANGLKKISYYHQGNENKDEEINDSVSKTGRLYKEELYNPNGKLEKKTKIEYAELASPLNANLVSVLPAAKLITDIDNNSGATYALASKMSYDNNLNLIREINYGDVLGTTTQSFTDINANDTKIVETKYVNSTLYTKRFLPASRVVRDISGNIISQEEYLYDNSMSTSTAFTTGLLTEKRVYASTNTIPLREKYSWDTNYGLINSNVDSRGATTTYSYDNYKLQVTQITNALGHTETSVPNYKVAKSSVSIDTNGLELKSEYDNFGRLLTSSKNNNLVEERVYTDAYLPEVKIVKYFTPNDSITSVIYYDGLGRVAKEKVENTNGSYTTRDYTYDNMGNVIRESLPYEVSALGRYDNITLPSYYYKYYTRDIYGRVTESKSAIGTDMVRYGVRDKRVIDNNKHETYYKYDKDNNIISVEESNEGAKYATNYAYDVNNNLISILDAENGVRNMSYDWLGRKIGDELTHDKGSLGYATNTTRYGKNNEYLQVLYGDGSQTKTNYDILGRKSSVVSSSTVLSEYAYDTCLNGKGKLCMASSSDGAIKKYVYDIEGNISSEETIVNNINWSPRNKINYKYDWSGNVISKGDGLATTTNTYSKNALQKISYVDTNSTSTDVFSNPSYNHLGQITSYDRGSIKQLNSFDDKNLNRLNNLSLLRYGTSSYPYFSTSTTFLLPLNNATLTASVIREKGLTSDTLIRVSKVGASYVSSDNAITSVGIVRTLSPLATATPITQAQARAGLESFYGPISANGIGLTPVHILYQNSSAQAFIDGIKATTYMRRSDGNQAADLMQIFKTSNPRDASIPLPSNLTLSTADNALSWSTNKKQGVATSTFVGAYYNLFVKDKLIQLNDPNSFVRLYKRNAGLPAIVNWPDSGQTYRECDTSRPYSDPISMISIATGTYLQIPVNTNYINDYFNASSTNQYVSVCLLEGHSINNTIINLSTSTPLVRNEILVSNSFGELYNPNANDQVYKIYAGLTVNYTATNTKLRVVNMPLTNLGQGLQVRLDVNVDDIEKDKAESVEVYLSKKGASTTTPSYLYTMNNLATNTATHTLSLDNFPFEHGQNYILTARARDTYGDWSNYATTSYSAGVKNSTSTNVVKCASFSLTDLGSVNCPDPEYNIKIDIGYIAPLNLNYTLIPQGWGYYLKSATITVATSTNYASSTVGYLYSDKHSNVDLGGNGGNGVVFKFKSSEYNGMRLKPNAKYYYKINAFISGIPYPDVERGGFVFTTGDFTTFQNSSYSYDTLSRIKSILKDDDKKFENTLYTYDELSRLKQVDKIYTKNSSSTTITESYSYSPTGRILSNTGANYTYSSNLMHAPVTFASSSLSYDKRGRLATSSDYGVFTFNNLDRLREVSKANGNVSTTSKYYYDTEGNRVLSLTYKNAKLSATTSTSTLISRLFTPNSWTQDTGSTTSYAISLGSKPIINIDRVWRNVISTSTTTTASVAVSTSTRSISTTTPIVITTVSTSSLISSRYLGLPERQAGALAIQNSDEFTSTGNLSSYTHNSSDTLSKIAPYIGRKSCTGCTSKQRITLNNLSVGKTQMLIIYSSETYNNQPYYVNTILGTTTSLISTFTIGTSTATNTGHFSKLISFIPKTPSLTLEFESRSTNVHYITLDAYLLYLTEIKYATTTSVSYVTSTTTQIITSTSSVPTVISTTTLSLTPTSTTNIHILITDHLNSIESILDFKTGNTISSTTYNSFGSQSKSLDSNSNRSYTNHQYDKDNNLLYMNARYQIPKQGQFISSDNNVAYNVKSLLANPQDLNAYSYVRNNPIHYTDPSGNCIWDMCVVEAAIAMTGGAYLGVQLGLGNEVSAWDYLGAIPALGAGTKVVQGTNAIKRIDQIPETLYHYTSDKGLKGILSDMKINPSYKTPTGVDAVFGNGQYVTDIKPGSMKKEQIAEKLFLDKEAVNRVSNFIQISTKGLEISKGRENVFIINNNFQLNIKNRIINSGKNK